MTDKLTSTSKCSTSEDCGSSSKICQANQCICKDGYSLNGKHCEFTGACKPDNPCLNGGECKAIEEDGSFYCDCPEGFIDPYCNSQDPCVMRGEKACQHGSTCVKKGHYEFVCKCRIPYVGEFCESYNLCEVEMEECFEDLQLVNPSEESMCYPCVVGSECTQVSIREYECSCSAGINHTNCLKANYDESDSLRTPFLPPTDNLSSPGAPTWNPIIPTIALTSFGLYILLMVILLIIRRNRAKYRPKLIVCCDIHEFDNLAFYLISVETGNDWGGGTGCNVFCFLCGENGNAGPFPLNDSNLREVTVLERGQEDNYLVSHTKDLGRIDKIVISYHDEHRRNDTWLCERVTVKNVKTEENWFFFTSACIRPRSAIRNHEFLVASQEFVKKWNRVSISGRHYRYQLLRHHAYISPFVYFTEQRITLAFAEYMTYMIVLIGLYGFLSLLDPDFYTHAEYMPSLIVLKNGSITAACCFLVGIIFALCFEFSYARRIPTLIVWKNRPGMPQDSSNDPSSEEEIEQPIIVPMKDQRQFIDKATNTDPFKPKIKRTKRKKQIRVPILIKHAPAQVSIPRSPFRIPYTNITRTERWIYENAAGTSGPGELQDDSLVHDTTTFRDKLPAYYYSSTNIHDPNQSHLQTENPAHPTGSKRDHEEESYQTVEVEISDVEEVLSNENIEVENQSADKNRPEQNSTATIFTSSQPKIELKPEPTSTLAGGDAVKISTVQKKKNTAKRRKSGNKLKVYCELVEMDAKEYGKSSSGKSLVMIGWILCLCAIIVATVICCIYGGRYGYQRTYDWIISLVICWTENFLFYQFIKVFVVVILVTCLVNQKKLSSYEAEKIRRRFQVCHLDGLTVLPQTYKLKFIQYLPKYWIPAPNIKLPTS